MKYNYGYMGINEKQFEALLDPKGSGVVRIEGFLDDRILNSCQAEFNDPKLVPWRDDHKSYLNIRDIMITQNHDVYALTLEMGDQSWVDRLPNIKNTADKMQGYVVGLSDKFPSLADWQYNELTLHQYDDPELGLSFHFDSPRFLGVLAIAALDGECELATRAGNFPALPGDLFLLRTTGLIDSDEDLRPEHSVINLKTPTRTSMTLRSNSRPYKKTKDFKFDNLPDTGEA